MLFKLQPSRVVSQELFDVEQNKLDQHEAFEFSCRLTRFQFISIASVAFDCYARNGGVFDGTVQGEFNVDDIVLAEVTLENSNCVAGKS